MMNNRNLLNLGLLALIGVLALLAIYEPGIEPPAESPNLLQLDATQVNRVTIQRHDKQDVVLARDAKGVWQMEAPVHHPADVYRIESLLRVTVMKSLNSFAAEGERLAGYQLDKPRATLTLATDAGETRLAFGSATPLDQRRYVMIGGQVHLASDTLYYHLIGGFTTFLRKQLLDEGSSIEGLTLPGLEVAWQGGGWAVTPRPEGFSADQVTRLVDSWKLASALEIKPYDQRPGERITLRLAGMEQPYELLLTAREPDLVLARPDAGVQYHLDSGSAAALMQLPSLDERETAAGATEDSDNEAPTDDR